MHKLINAWLKKTSGTQKLIPNFSKTIIQLKLENEFNVMLKLLDSYRHQTELVFYRYEFVFISVHKKIRIGRKAKGLTLEEIAYQLGVSLYFM